MITAELRYNPYLLKTEVLFDGQEPRINSLVERYQGMPLHDWVHLVPDIFHDEMNGYDFELDFTGTAEDFADLVSAFQKKGVSSDDVVLFHKNELESRSFKQVCIDELLDWLKNHTNVRLSYSDLRTDNEDLFFGKYPYIVLNGRKVDTSVFDDTDISIDKIENTDEIKTTDIKDVPILIYIDGANYQFLRDIIYELFLHEKINHEQLFFMIDRELNRDMVKRVISDLGVKNPQIVSAPDDVAVMKYIEMYPVSDFLYNCIALLRTTFEQIKVKLDLDANAAEAKNRQIFDRLRDLDNRIQKIKDAQFALSNRDRYSIPDDFVVNRSNLFKTINSWRVRKTKITDRIEAIQYATEFSDYVISQYKKYTSAMEVAFNDALESIKGALYSRYCESQPEYSFMPTLNYDPVIAESIPDFATELMTLKKEEYVTPKDNSILFRWKKNDDSEREPVLETTYFLNEWREYAVQKLSHPTDEYSSELHDCLNQCGIDLTEAYLEELKKALEKNTSLRDSVSDQLSDSEKRIQTDIDWLGTAMDMLKDIESR